MTEEENRFEALTGADSEHPDVLSEPPVVGVPSGVATVPPPSSHTATRLILIRHGEAACNVWGVCGGPKGCTGLTSHGIRQVEALRNRLLVTGELAGADVLYSSVLPRAIETAEIVAPALAPRETEGPAGPVPRVELDCGLCELHPGEADGLTWEEFTRQFGDPDWDVDPDRVIAPGGESWTGFVARVAETLEAVVARHPGSLVVAACHAGVIEAAMLAMLPVAGGWEGARLQLRTHHSSITGWEIDHGRWRLLGFNDAGHLSIPGAVPVPAPVGADQQA